MVSGGTNSQRMLVDLTNFGQTGKAVEKLLDEISYRALPEALIEKIEVDVGDMKLGDSIKVKDLPIASDKDIDLLTDPETVVANVTAVRNAVETTDEEGAAEEAAQ